MLRMFVSVQQDLERDCHVERHCLLNETEICVPKHDSYDLHCQCPGCEWVYYGNRKPKGQLLSRNPSLYPYGQYNCGSRNKSIVTRRILFLPQSKNFVLCSYSSSYMSRPAISNKLPVVNVGLF